MKFKGLSEMKVKKRSNSCSAGDQRFISGTQPAAGRAERREWKERSRQRGERRCVLAMASASGGQHTPIAARDLRRRVADNRLIYKV